MDLWTYTNTSEMGIGFMKLMGLVMPTSWCPKHQNDKDPLVKMNSIYYTV